MGGANVHAALSLVGYESDLRKAMQYVFGSTLVCDTLDNAKRVAFDKKVMTKTVTLGGDIFDPQGTLSGGEGLCRCSALYVPFIHHFCPPIIDLLISAFPCFGILQAPAPSRHRFCPACRS